MPQITITRRLEFDAAHRVMHHESKCKHIHGHRYRAELTVSAPGLDDLGRVIDFGVVKQIVGGWINNHWDHNIILHQDDPLLDRQVMSTPTNLQSKYATRVFGGKWPYVMQGNPTAENMAAELWRCVHGLLPPPIDLIRVRLYETPNAYADYLA